MGRRPPGLLGQANSRRYARMPFVGTTFPHHADSQRTNIAREPKLCYTP